MACVLLAGARTSLKVSVSTLFILKYVLKQNVNLFLMFCLEKSFIPCTNFSTKTATFSAYSLRNMLLISIALQSLQLPQPNWCVMGTTELVCTFSLKFTTKLVCDAYNRIGVQFFLKFTTEKVCDGYNRIGVHVFFEISQPRRCVIGTTELVCTFFEISQPRRCVIGTTELVCTGF